MKWREMAAMAVGNLRKSPWRTVLNAGSVFIGCLLLFLVLAGTRGISDGIRYFVEQNQLLRKVMFYPSYDPETEVPEEVIQVSGEMSDERRERIRKRLENQWHFSHMSRRPVDMEFIDEMKEWPHVVEVVPEVFLPCEIEIGGAIDSATIESSLVGVSVNDHDIRSRIEFGDPLELNDEEGILLHEFAAYQLGWRDERQLSLLIGRELTIKHQVSRRQLSGILAYMQSGAPQSSFQDRVLLIETLRQLFEEMDATGLTEVQKTLLREVLTFDLDNSEEEDRLVAVHTFVIRGIFRDPDRGKRWGWMINSFGRYGPELYLAHPKAVKMFLQDPHGTGFEGGTIEVDSYRQVTEVEQTLEKHGMQTMSAALCVENIDEQIEFARRTAGGIAVVIFFIAALGIANALTISVLQRTREIGIMKSLGARDSDILRMMLLEGILIGLLGVVSALITALVASLLLNQLVKSRLLDSWGLEYSLAIFNFSILDVTMVFAIAMGTTALSSVFPARRAARLDAVQAMQL